VLAIPVEESTLLMHFLDEVFPLQYPMYKPSVFQGGRGWLLALLLRTKPLFHVALAFAIYHRRIATHTTLNEASRMAYLVQQETNLGLSIEMLNTFAQNSCPASQLGIVTSVAQLMFFEVWTSVLKNKK
jgi:hypothetical protein